MLVAIAQACDFDRNVMRRSVRRDSKAVMAVPCLLNPKHINIPIYYNSLDRCRDTTTALRLIFRYELMEQAYCSFAISSVNMSLKRIKRL